MCSKFAHCAGTNAYMDCSVYDALLLDKRMLCLLYVCQRESERDREIERLRDREREKERERARKRERERGREIEWKRDK